MRKIILPIICIFSVQTFSSSGTIALNSSVTSASGSTRVLRGESSSQVSSQSIEASISTGTIKNLFDFRASVTNSKSDYDSYIVRDEIGTESKISETFDGKETILSLGGDLLIQNFTLSLDGQKTVTDSPFEKEVMSYKVSHSHYNLGNISGFSITQSKKKRPRDFLRNPETLSTEEIPTLEEKTEYQFSTEQILTENLKILGDLKYLDQHDLRSDAYGFKIQPLIGLTDSIGLSGSYEVIQEKKNIKPIDGSGHYELYAYKAGIIFEPTYDLIFKIIGGTIIEIESERGINPRQRVGTDLISLSASYDFKNFNIATQVDLEESNTGYENKSFSGGLTWEI